MILLLLSEVLKPLSNMKFILQPDGVMLFATLLLFIYLIFKNKFLLFLGGITSIIISLEFLYNTESLSFLDWIKQFYLATYNDIFYIFQFNWAVVPIKIRTIFFLILMWIVIKFLIKLINTNKSFLIVIAAATYISIMETYYSFEGKWSIIKVIAFGLILIGIQLKRQLLAETKESKSFSTKFVVIITILSLSIVSIGYAMPKEDEAKWYNLPSFLSFLENGQGVFSDKKRIGYGEDDTNLGGALIHDDTVIMETRSNKLLYWRGESKEFYTGKGWISGDYKSSENAIWVPIDGSKSNNEIPDYLTQTNPELEKEELNYSLVFPNTKYQHYFQAGDFEHITVINDPSINSAKLGIYTNKLMATSELESYNVKSNLLVVDREALSKTDDNYPQVITDVYLQLPEDLPNRVSNLAEEITERYDNPYDKVNAIERYLRTNYTYDTKNVPAPRGNQDFVDQFLFESKTGYCDHFSTSMVVLARSAGVPTRWVKGFSPGEIKYSSATGEYIGTVTNNNAHSWVEVYFSGIGWVPFEPTPNFRYPTLYKATEDEDELRFDRNPDIEEDNTNNQGVEKQNNTNTTNKAANSIIYYLAAIIIIIAILLLAYGKQLSFYLTKYFISRKYPVRSLVQIVTAKMIFVLEKRNSKKEDSETVREYFTTVFEQSKDDEWKEAVNIYELASYSNEEIPKTWKMKIWDLWKKVIGK